MTTTQNTETTVLAHHGIVAAQGENIIDVAREAGLIYACLGCGSVGGIAPLGNSHYLASTWASQEQNRADSRDAILDEDEHAFDCCSDADTIIY
jgi:uncharacterized metal-binding protein